ncbi:MAG: hypothetical protein PGMFKBFP_03275 [Anaerolineales bacterium]|nr:hypothetical protein [Anaerolineales bacterium]
MKNLRKLLVTIPVLVFILACQAVTRPFDQAKNTASTAAAFATQAGSFVTQASGFATEIAPFETLMPNPSAMPELPSGNPLDPKSPPLSEWKGIPIMPQASAGEELEGMYTFKVAADSKEIQDFYDKQLTDLGWESSFSMPVAGTSMFLFTKGDQVLTITVMPSDAGGAIVMLTLT